MSTTNRQLHWSQRVALVRHNLHAASRSGNFHFFKTLQANGFMEGTSHVATLSEELGDDADVILAALDNLNAGLAYFHQDAFGNVYENLKNNLRKGDDEADKSKLHVDIAMQKNMADMAIDKMASSALALIQQQPTNPAQEAAASVWITGVTVVADTVEVALQALDSLEHQTTDFIRLEESWNNVKASAVCAVTVLKGIFRLMDPSGPQDQQKSTRSSSIVSASGLMLRRISGAFAGAGGGSSSSRSSSVTSAALATTTPSGTHGRHPSLSSIDPVYRMQSYGLNGGAANGCPPPSNDFPHHKLSTIPPTPGSGSGVDDHPDPFDTSVPLPAEMLSMPAMPMPSLSLEQRRFSQAAF